MRVRERERFIAIALKVSESTKMNQALPAGAKTKQVLFGV